ncbi:MAG: DUF3868 domain-containing protein [Proteiniphilum sp.]
MSTKRLNPKIMVTSFLLGVVYCTLLVAQSRIADESIVKQSQISKKGDLVSFDMDLNLHLIEIGKNETLIITPLLQSNSEIAVIDSFPPLIINGSIRDKVMNRQNTLNIQNHTTNLGPLETIKKDRYTPQIYSYHATLPFKQWMQDASLVLVNETRGCADCDMGSESKVLFTRVFHEKKIPQFQLTYIEPEPEPVKARSERHSASFNYQFDRYNLVREYKNNAAELDKVARVVSEVQGNKDLTITELIIEGFASPEGGFEYNHNLSDKRANSFADYLAAKHRVDRRQMKHISGVGEDWIGLRKAVENSQITHKQKIIQIIDSVFPPDARDAELMKLSGGETYQQLLTRFYPPLRRTDYIIAYSVRAFSVEEAKAILKSNPRLLSLNEMYLVAETYPKESKEFKEVFDIAARLYPDDPIAIINSAATKLETGNFSEALKQLEKVKEDPRAWNNMGVAHAKEGDLRKATEFFKKAVDKGDLTAAANIDELKKATTNQ